MAFDALSQILGALKMRGTIYFHTNFTPPWGVRVPAYKNVARFHMVIRGHCWIRVEGVPHPIALATGDLVVIPHGASHILSDTPERKAEDVDEIMKRVGYSGTGALVHGGGKGGHPSQLFCGHFEFEEGAMHPILSALPNYIHIANTETANAAWLDPIMRFVFSEVVAAKPGAAAITHRLTEIIFIQVVRAFVDRAGDAAGCLAGILDSRLSRALAAVHADPQKPWTVDAMAAEAGMSRTPFAERFTALIGMTPLAYVTHWRMQLARRLLIETNRPQIEIAEQAGYQSESAFSRAFKRQFDIAPGNLRRAAR